MIGWIMDGWYIFLFCNKKLEAWIASSAKKMGREIIPQPSKRNNVWFDRRGENSIGSVYLGISQVVSLRRIKSARFARVGSAPVCSININRYSYNLIIGQLKHRDIPNGRVTAVRPFINRLESSDNIAFRRCLQEPRNLGKGDRKWVEIVDMSSWQCLHDLHYPLAL